MRSWLKYGLGILAVLVVIGGISKNFDPPATERQAAKSPTASQEINEVPIAKALIIERLKDPDSASFRNVQYVKHSCVVCGEVNAHNGFGGYTGYKSFIVDHGLVFSEESRDRGFADMWNSECAGPSEPDETDPAAPHFYACQARILKRLHKGEYIVGDDAPKDFGEAGQRSFWLTAGRGDESTKAVYCWVRDKQVALIDADPDNTDPADKARPPWFKKAP